VKDRVQRHRASLEANQRRRLDVCISSPLIDKVRTIAQWREKSISSTVQHALECYVVEYQLKKNHAKSKESNNQRHCYRPLQSF
jgi:hypothetical protein